MKKSKQTGQPYSGCAQCKLIPLLQVSVRVSVPPEGCASWLWHLLGLFTDVFQLHYRCTAHVCLFWKSEAIRVWTIFCCQNWFWVFRYNLRRLSLTTKRQITTEIFFGKQLAWLLTQLWLINLIPSLIAWQRVGSKTKWQLPPQSV